MNQLDLLDCTLRDGAYVVKSNFGSSSISGIISNLQNANIEIIECGWLKNDKYIEGTTFFHLPSDLNKYISKKNMNTYFVLMIDYNRYNCDFLPRKEEGIIDAIRVVFSKNDIEEGFRVCEKIRSKGYDIYIQLANTIGYSEGELKKVIRNINEFKPKCVSIVDTFGGMYPADLEKLVEYFDENLDIDIQLGFHSHNNLQLSFALSIQFIEIFINKKDRKIVVDSTLCGMGRGAGNTCTELIVEYINRNYGFKYNIDMIMDTIDKYILYYIMRFQWGYSIAYAIAGMYGCHVNNVSYLSKTHRIKSRDMRAIFDALPQEKRVGYDYDFLEKVYLQYQNNNIDDKDAIEVLKKEFEGKEVIAILPGKSSEIFLKDVCKKISERKCKVIGINAIVKGYSYDWLFFGNSLKYEFARESYSKEIETIKIIRTSNIEINSSFEKESIVVNYFELVKRNWKYYDNSMLMFLRLMRKIRIKKILVVGFDGYKEKMEAYAENTMKPVLEDSDFKVLNEEIKEMIIDFFLDNDFKDKIEFITPSVFDV